MWLKADWSDLLLHIQSMTLKKKIWYHKFSSREYFLVQIPNKYFLKTLKIQIIG